MTRKLQYIDNLIHVKRYSGNLLIKEESVADHTWCMISLAIEYVPQLNKFNGVLFSLEKVISAIAVHDVEECLTGDIMRPFKYHNQLILDAVKSTSDQITLDYLGRDMYEYIKKVTDKNTSIGLLVKIFDLAQAGYKMISEIKLGNQYFENELDNVLDCLNGIWDKVKSANIGDPCKKSLEWLITEFFNEFKDFLKLRNNE